MISRIKRMIVLAMIVFTMINGSVLAETENTIMYLAEMMAVEHLEEFNMEYSVIGATPLYDSADRLNGALLHLKSNDASGYMIYYNLDGKLKLTEFSFESDLKFKNSEKLYYNGLTMYGSKEKGKIVNIYTGEELEPYYSINQTVKIPTEKLHNAIETRTSFNVGYSILDYPVDPIIQTSAGPNGNNKCMQTSAAMLIQYWDKNKSGFSDITNNSGVNLVYEIEDYVPLNGNITYLSTLVNGMRNYLTSKGFGYSVNSYSCDLNNDTLPEDYIFTVKQDILNEKPSIVIVGREAQYLYEDGIDLDSGVNHALLVKGTTYANDLYGDTNDYLITVDPMDGITKYVVWDPYNWEDRQDFAVYSIIRIDIWN